LLYMVFLGEVAVSVVAVAVVVVVVVAAAAAAAADDDVAVPFRAPLALPEFGTIPSSVAVAIATLGLETIAFWRVPDGEPDENASIWTAAWREGRRAGPVAA